MKISVLHPLHQQHTCTHMSMTQRKMGKPWGWKKKKDLKFKAMVGEQQLLWLKMHMDPITSARTEVPMVRDTIRGRSQDRYRGQPHGQNTDMMLHTPLPAPIIYKLLKLGCF